MTIIEGRGIFTTNASEKTHYRSTETQRTENRELSADCRWFLGRAGLLDGFHVLRVAAASSRARVQESARTHAHYR
jgi:hypothetical protein